MNSLLQPFHKFFQLQLASSILLLSATLLALGWANSPWATYYEQIWQTPWSLSFGSMVISESIHFWINECLMTIFFFVVGLEIKRELWSGELSTLRKACLPIMAAIGGMVVPALIYFGMVGAQNPFYRNGWGIPTVTDIAFALGTLSILGNRVPIGLKVFLTALAIVDDLGAIFLIALFYSNELHGTPIILSGWLLLTLFLLNRFKISQPLPYLLLGLLLWAALWKSGLHATLAGVLLAFTIPSKSFYHRAPLLEQLETKLNPWVSYFILPLFALANAGVQLPLSKLETVLNSPITIGIVVSLFFGKQLGITGFSWLAVRLNLAELPSGVGWPTLYGASILGGIGFTMSIFITLLAFQQSTWIESAKVGILIASLLSGLAGILVLFFTLPSGTLSDKTSL